MRLVEESSIERGGQYSSAASEVLPTRGFFSELFLNAVMNSRPRHLYEFGPFVLNPAEHTLLRDGQPLPLRPKVFDMLLVLVERHNHLIEKDELMSAVWPEQYVEEGNLNKTVSLLRLALGESVDGVRYIETVPKRGYRFAADVRKVGDNGDPEPVVKPHTRASLVIEEEMDEGTPAAAGGAQVGEADVAEPTRTPSASGQPAGLAEWRFKAKQAYALPLIASAAAVIIAVAAIGYFFYSAKGGSYATSGEAIDSVAVMPFVNAGGDPNTEYLADGISDSIINSLSRLPNLKVKSLNSVLRYKGKQPDPQAVGRELNVRAVLMGKLTQRGDALAISAELVDARDSSRLWGGHYNRKLSDILAVQEEIAREMTASLRLRLTGEEKQQLAKQYTENTDAYLLYSLGNYYYRQNTKEGYEKSIESFEQAIKLDPHYALAYAGLAHTYQFMESRNFSPAKKYEQKVEWAALKALQLDDTLAEAHVALGAHKFYNFDWGEAEKEIKRALELDPNSAQANEAYSVYLRIIKGAEESLPYAIRARELDPTPDRGQAAFDYYLARQYDKAIELYRKNLEQKPDNAHAHILLGEAYVAKGLPAEGVAEMQKGLALDTTLAKTPERWDRYPLLAYAYAAAGRRDEALKILDAQKRLAQQRHVSPYNFAIIYTGLGDKDRAFEWLTKCVEQRTLIIFHLKSRPLFDPLRADPRYAVLLRRMNLEP